MRLTLVEDVVLGWVLIMPAAVTVLLSFKPSGAGDGLPFDV